MEVLWGQRQVGQDAALVKHSETPSWPPAVHCPALLSCECGGSGPELLCHTVPHSRGHMQVPELMGRLGQWQVGTMESGTWTRRLVSAFRL